MTGFPFDHLTLAEVAECERLAKLDQKGQLWDNGYGPLNRMLSKRHPPIYDRPTPGPRVA